MYFLTHTDGTAGSSNGGETFNTGGKSRSGNSEHRELHLGVISVVLEDYAQILCEDDEMESESKCCHDEDARDVGRGTRTWILRASLLDTSVVD